MNYFRVMSLFRLTLGAARPNLVDMNTANAASRKIRASLNERLIIANNERAALNRVRGRLGHGVIYHADKAEKMAALDAEIANLRATLATLA